MKSSLKKITSILILSGHIVELHDLRLRNDDETILSIRFNFIAVQSLDGKSVMDGNYIVYNTKRYTCFRSGTAEVGMLRRWKERAKVSIRSNHTYCSNNVYMACPNLNCLEIDLPSERYCKGNFQQVVQLIRIGYTKNVSYSLLIHSVGVILKYLNLVL